ncbi:uncharacterized protein LOC132737264 [Ruditapes philippinarum]|uniref:uncharacterized protein LOC132737264 n=1 Tax=Ruditapes philippinarum TaxID=129788 RepID=UPI00295AD137|nr:uncharacterized protein LOC132737264 [Ruditapes philippinarum]
MASTYGPEANVIYCGDVPTVIKGSVTLLEENNTTYKARANVSCHTGYNASIGIIQCLETGQWQATECQLLVCEAVPDIANGQITLTQVGNTTYGAIANVSCSTGYNATVYTLLCLDTGEWDTATCNLIDCSVVPKVSNGNVALLGEENTTYGALAEIACETGYNFSVPTIQCRDTGVWDTATCDIIDCGRLDDLMNGTIITSNGTTYGSTATYTCDEGLDIIGDVTRICDASGQWSKTKPDCLLKGAKRCPENTDARGNVWNAIAGGRNRSNACPTNFIGTVNRQCGVDGLWKFLQYLCIRESVNKVMEKINLLNKDTSQHDVLNALQGLNIVTTQAENIAEQDKLTDFEVSSLITSTGTVADILSSSPTLINNQLTDVFTESISNLIDEKNSGSWNAITQTSSKMTEKMLSSVDTLSNAMAKRVNSTGISLPAVVKPNIALHVKAVSSSTFVFPGFDAVQGTSNDNWLRATKSQIIFNTSSFGGTSQQSVVSAAIYKDISNIMPDKSDNEQLNGQVLSFSTLPPLSGTIDPPITMSFEQTHEQLTRATCSFWKFGNSGSGAWSTEGCTGRSISENVTECECSHTTNFAVILSLQDCGGLGSLSNGEIDNSAGTKYKATANFRCNAGYNINGANTSTCLYNGSWSFPVPSCSIKDCGNLSYPLNGIVSTPEGTTFDNEAVYSCYNGYNLNGRETRLCLSTGSWSSTSPTCVKEVQTPKTCKENVDSRGLTWPETVSGNTQDKRCHSGFTGSISRTCGAGGVWNLPQYDCVRESIVKVNEKVSTLSKNATGDEVDTVLEEILKVTTVNETTDNNNTLTDGELSVLSASLETVADVLATSSGIINENITDEFLEIASNLVDESNQESWKSLSQSENNDESASVLKAVDSLAEVLSNSIKDDPENNGTIIVKKNIAIDVKKVSKKGVLFPDPDKTVSDKDDANVNWFKQAKSSLRLEAAAFKNKTVQYATTAVMYRDLSKILPNKRNNTNNNAEDTDDVINAPILSLTISPPVSDKLDPLLQLNFTHDMTNFSNPLCSYWAFPIGNIEQGFWSSEGCVVRTTNTYYTICECDHLTNFAVLMSPFVEADAASKALRIISMTGIGISIACLTVTLIVHVFFWKYLRNDRTTALINLCVALLLSYILFLAGVDRTESSVACAVIAAVLQYIYLVVFCIMLVEGIEIAIIVLYVFKTKSRIRIMLIFAWVIPAIIVGISLGAAQAEGYGNDNFCWLSVENGLIWSFVGPALFIITFNGICLIIVIRIMFKTKAMETKTASVNITQNGNKLFFE